MVKETIEGFKILVGTDGYEEFMVNSSRLDECLDYVITNNIKNIGINSYMGYSDMNIDFLSHLKNIIEGLVITETKYDIKIVNSLSKLKYLGFMDNKKDVIDLSNFPELETLACEYSERLQHLETCHNLKNLSLTGYKPRSNDLTGLPKLNSVLTLKLFMANIHTLDGIGRFPLIKELELFRASKLETLVPLDGAAETIESVIFEQCKNIKDIEILGKLNKLKKIILSECGEIQSLTFVTSLRFLEYLSFWGTKILDGNLSYCKGISFVGFKDSKHYSHNLAQFKH